VRTSSLACTVRDCGLPLDRRGATYTCVNGHAYDVARSGYVNLLQPQDRRSAAAGDSTAAVEARARLLARRIGRGPLDVLLRGPAALRLAPDAVVADLGSGSGDALAAVVGESGRAGIGIDLSTAAARHAARQFPHITWVVANADRRLPMVDGGLSLVMSLNGRRNPGECARVLEPSGILFVVLPAPDDLVELRTAVQGARVERSRIDALIGDHNRLFTVVERFTSRERHALDPSAMRDVLTGTYRGARDRWRTRIDQLPPMEVTFASDCVVFRRK
jgi:23S rRNA (guanine745-N1)-methyltransferase